MAPLITSWYVQTKRKITSNKPNVKDAWNGSCNTLGSFICQNSAHGQFHKHFPSHWDYFINIKLNHYIYIHSPYKYKLVTMWEHLIYIFFLRFCFFVSFFCFWMVSITQFILISQPLYIQLIYISDSTPERTSRKKFCFKKNMKRQFPGSSMKQHFYFLTRCQSESSN